MFWICAGKRVGNRDVFVIAEQHLHRAKALSAPHPILSMGGAEGPKLRGATAGIAEHNQSKGHSIPHGIMLSIWKGKKEEELHV